MIIFAKKKERIKKDLRDNIPENKFNSFTGTSTEIIAVNRNLNISLTVDVFENFLQ